MNADLRQRAVAFAGATCAAQQSVEVMDQATSGLWMLADTVEATSEADAGGVKVFWFNTLKFVARGLSDAQAFAENWLRARQEGEATSGTPPVDRGGA